MHKNISSHLGVYAAILDDTQSSILLIKKALGCYTGLYDLPGGSLEPHELLEDALKREVLEETGCTVTSCQQLCSLSVLYDHVDKGMPKTLRHIGVIYSAKVSGIPRATSDGTDDSAGCLWVPFADLHEKNAAPFVLMSVDFLKQRRAA